MKITKFQHACLLVEMPAPINRTALFDPGVMSEEALQVDRLTYLDDIIITHVHPDHVSQKLLSELVAKFPDVRITAPQEVVTMLATENITATTTPPDGVVLFNAPHEKVEPLFPQPEQIGVHYLDRLTHPGDSHSFTETKAILALPLAGPWASAVTGVNLALQLKPQYVLPIHDWHLSDQARGQMYAAFDKAFNEQGINFVSLQTAEPVVLDV